MATPLGTTFVTDEQVVAQGDVLYKGKMVESLVVEFDQAKYEEFLSSGSRSPKARACRRVSTRICPKIRSEILSDAAAVKDVVANRAMRDTRANVSQETRVVNFPGVQPIYSLPQHQVVGGSPQTSRRNRNTERRQRRRARQLQVGTKVGREAQTSVPHPTREVRVWQPKREVHQVGSSEAPLPRRQGETRAPCQVQEARASKRGAQQPRIHQASLPRRNYQQCESCVSHQQRRQAHAQKQRRKSCVQAPHVSEPRVLAVQSKDASRPRHCEANLFDPPPTDLRDI